MSVAVLSVERGRGAREGRREDAGMVVNVERVVEERIDSGSTMLYNVENQNERVYA